MKDNNTDQVINVTADDLPMHCPPPNSDLWDSHPRVFIPLEDTGEASCSYCGNKFRLVEGSAAKASND